MAKFNSFIAALKIFPEIFLGYTRIEVYDSKAINKRV
jgi:hypothetical protein